jgi:hypothetical protein
VQCSIKDDLNGMCQEMGLFFSEFRIIPFRGADIMF